MSDSKRSKIKVANVFEEGRFAGPLAWVVAVAERLQRGGIESIVIFPKKNSDFFHKKLTEKGIQTRRLSLHCLTRQKVGLVRYFILFIYEVISLYKMIKKEDVDIVNCNNSWQIKGVLAGKLAGKKLVWTVHETERPHFINIIFKFLALYFCDAFMTAGERARSYYLEDGKFVKKQIMVVQSPVDTSVLEPQKVKEDPKIARYRGIKIVTVGNISRIKGIEYFVEMASILNKRYKNLNFVIVGPQFKSQKRYSQRLYNRLEKLGIGNVDFYGRSDDVPSVLKAADIYVCSSIAESSPLSVWEAMTMAKPIVSTDVGDVKRFIKNGENGFVVPTKNATAMAEKVGLLIENEQLRGDFGQQARGVALKYLDVEICAKKHAEFYKEIMNKP